MSEINEVFDYYHWLKEVITIGTQVLIEHETSYRRDETRMPATVIGLNRDTIVVQTSCEKIMEFSRNKGCKRKANGGFEDIFIRQLTPEYHHNLAETAKRKEGIEQKKELIRSIIKKLTGEKDCCSTSFDTGDTNIPVQRLVWIDTQLENIPEEFERYDWEPDNKVTKSGHRIF